MAKKDLTTQHLEDYQKIIKNLPFYFTGGTKIAVGKTPSNNKIKAILTNDKILNGFWLTSTFLIVMIKEKCDFERVVMMIWTICAVVQLATRGINGVLHHVDINDLLDWYLNLYKPCGNPKFQVVFDDILKKQNYYINLIMNILPPITFIPGIIYIGGPQFSEGKVLPTPIIWNGVPSEEFSTPVFLVMYLVLIYSAWNVTMCVVASDCFFSLSSILMGHRFAAIGGILKLLNYKGERDSEGDMKIIKYCYLMHLDLLDKVEKFGDYFSLYGLFHFVSPILGNVVLSYFLHKNGFHLLSVSIVFTLSFQISLACFFGQVLTNSAYNFCEDLYELNWYDFKVREQKMFLLMLIKSQETVSIKAGHVYELNLPMLTQVAKFQASFYAFLKTF